MWNNMKDWTKMQNFKYKDLIVQIDEKAAKLENVEYELCRSEDVYCLTRCVLDSNLNKSMTMSDSTFKVLKNFNQ